MGTKRTWWESRGILGTKGRQWRPGGDDEDQEELRGEGGEMMGTKR